jgi:large subunit ribosomal protein L29
MKQTEIKSLSIDELKDKLATEQEGFQKLQFAHAISPIENPMKIRHTRKLIARLQTALTAKKATVK